MSRAKISSVRARMQPAWIKTECPADFSPVGRINCQGKILRNNYGEPQLLVLAHPAPYGGEFGRVSAASAGSSARSRGAGRRLHLIGQGNTSVQPARL